MLNIFNDVSVGILAELVVVMVEFDFFRLSVKALVFYY